MYYSTEHVNPEEHILLKEENDINHFHYFKIIYISLSSVRPFIICCVVAGNEKLILFHES